MPILKRIIDAFTSESGNIMANKYITIILILFVIALGTLNLLQNNKMKRLREINTDYEKVKKEMVQIQKDYESLSEKYMLANDNLIVIQTSLESTKIEIDKIVHGNITSLTAIKKKIEAIRLEIDTIPLKVDTPIYIH
jgi:hypothetical protein